MGRITQNDKSTGFLSALALAWGIKKIRWYTLTLTLFLLIFCSLWALLPLPSATTMGKLSFFYFNPDSVQSNFSLLTKEIDHFLTAEGYKVRFQAFSQQADFDRLLATQRPDFVLVPDWYYREYAQTMGLVPLLTSLNEDNQDSYTKLLLKRAGAGNQKNLSGKTVAVTTMGMDTDKKLTYFFDNAQPFDFAESHLIITPKDADALYALALGQVDLAVVGKNTMAAIAAINKKIVAVVTEVAPSKPVPMPLLCTLNGEMNREEIDRLKQVFFATADRQALPNFMKMLQFKGWRNANL